MGEQSIEELKTENTALLASVKINSMFWIVLLSVASLMSITILQIFAYYGANAAIAAYPDNPLGTAFIQIVVNLSVMTLFALIVVFFCYGFGSVFKEEIAKAAKYIQSLKISSD